MTRRLDKIKKLLLERKEISVQELSDLYEVSAVSIRKDLTRLEEEGFLKRVYGGAILSENNTLYDESSIPNTSVSKSIQNQDEDVILYQLAQFACSTICDGDIIFLGSGRTCCILAKLLHKFSDLSVVTNNITALDDLLSSGVRIYLLGGEVTSTDGITLFSSPEDPANFTQNIRVNKAFTSISGIDLDKGLTVNSIISTYIYRYLPEICNQWYLMTSSNKFNKLSMYSAAKLTDVNCIITDDYPPEYEAFFRENHIEIVTVAPNIASDHEGSTL